MLTCTFFGSKDTSTNIESKLYSIIVDLITNKKVYTYYVGNNGNFDSIVANTLKKLKSKYPCINYYIILAYPPYKKVQLYNQDFSNTIFPEDLTNTPPRYAIVNRNKWMIEKSDYVITYVNNPFGNTIKFKSLSLQKGKIVIDLTDYA